MQKLYKMIGGQVDTEKNWIDQAGEKQFLKDCKKGMFEEIPEKYIIKNVIQYASDNDLTEVSAFDLFGNFDLSNHIYKIKIEEVENEH